MPVVRRQLGAVQPQDADPLGGGKFYADDTMRCVYPQLACIQRNTGYALFATSALRAASAARTRATSSSSRHVAPLPLSMMTRKSDASMKRCSALLHCAAVSVGFCACTGKMRSNFLGHGWQIKSSTAPRICLATRYSISTAIVPPIVPSIKPPVCGSPP